MSKLTDTKIKAVKLPTDKQIKRLSDGEGMYLRVKKSGKFFMFDYIRPDTRKRTTITLGKYPDTTLSRAREQRTAARQLLAQGIDPTDYRKQQEAIGGSTFEAVAREWYGFNKDRWADSTGKRVLGNFEKHIFPWLGNKPVSDIGSGMVLKALQRIADSGAKETAHRTLWKIREVYQYAIGKGVAEKDVTAGIKGLLPVPDPEKGHAAITEPSAVGELMRAIDNYHGDFAVRMALKLTAYLFPRAGELRQMEWSELNADECLWVVPSYKMKRTKKGKANGIPHLVPLPAQALAILDELRPLTGHRAYVFPSRTDPNKPMSNNTVRQALRRMGYGNEQMTAHGFRSTASTLLYELSYPDELIERQLAHVVGNKVRRAYDSSELIGRRKVMMQEYADYLDKLKGTG